MARSARIRKVDEAERLAYDEAWTRKQRAKEAVAELAGFQSARLGDPFIPRVCPTCAANVSLSAVARHAEWHASLS